MSTHSSFNLSRVLGSGLLAGLLLAPALGAVASAQQYPGGYGSGNSQGGYGNSQGGYGNSQGGYGNSQGGNNNRQGARQQQQNGNGVRGVVSSFSGFNLTLHSRRSGDIAVHLHQGTVINPKGTTIQPGMRVAVQGHRNSNGSFEADSINVRNGNTNGNNGYNGNNQQQHHDGDNQ